MESKTNRLKTTAEIGKLVANHYVDLNQAHERGFRVAWTCGGGPFLPLLALDVVYHHAPSYAAWCCGRKVNDEMLRYSESAGYLPELCSYKKTSYAAALQIMEGTPMKPEVMLPKPDFVFGVRNCPLMLFWLDSMAHLMDVPLMTIEQPQPATLRDYDLNYDRNLAYVERQITDNVIPFLEDITGRKLDYERLGKLVGIMGKVVELRRYSRELTKNIPSPCTFFEFGMSQAPVMNLAGEDEALGYFGRFRAELEQRVAQGIAAVPGEKYRLYWHHIPVWHKIGHLTEKLASYGACLVAAEYSHGEGFPADPKIYNPKEPVRSIARQIVYSSRSRIPEVRDQHLLRLLQEYSIDGLIVHNHQTCKYVDIGEPDVLLRAEETLGKPGVMINCDAVDPSHYNESDWDMKLKALLEVIDARRKGAHR